MHLRSGKCTKGYSASAKTFHELSFKKGSIEGISKIVPSSLSITFSAAVQCDL